MASDSQHTLQAPKTAASIVKPGELIDVREMTPLTLNDRKIFNLLIQNAGDDIHRPVEHIVSKRELRLSDHNGNDRVGESIARLMSAHVRIRVERDGEASTQRIPLLADNIEHDRADGNFYYSFPAKLRSIIKDSKMFARLHKEVMLSFTSKYSLALYEMAMKRVNLDRKTEEQFSIVDFRELLGVPKDKLTAWSNLNNRAILPAVEEVNHRGLCQVAVDPVKTGRKVTHVRFRWWRAASDKIDDSIAELAQPSVGRRARMRGEVVDLHPPRLRDRLRSKTLDKAREIIRPARLDFHGVLEDWESVASSKGMPDNPDGAFIGFCQKVAREHSGEE